MMMIDLKGMLFFISAGPSFPPYSKQKPRICTSMTVSSETTKDSTDSTPRQDSATTCQSCGREGGPVAGCDGTGRIIGGLGRVINWWPIKAYRPCPDFIRAKGNYKRAGQSLEVR